MRFSFFKLILTFRQFRHLFALKSSSLHIYGVYLFGDNKILSLTIIILCWNRFSLSLNCLPTSSGSHRPSLVPFIISCYSFLKLWYTTAFLCLLSQYQLTTHPLLLLTYLPHLATKFLSLSPLTSHLHFSAPSSFFGVLLCSAPTFPFSHKIVAKHKETLWRQEGEVWRLTISAQSGPFWMPEKGLVAASTLLMFIKGMQTEGMFARFFQEAIAICVEVQELRENTDWLVCLGEMYKGLRNKEFTNSV